MTLTLDQQRLLIDVTGSEDGIRIPYGRDRRKLQCLGLIRQDLHDGRRWHPTGAGTELGEWLKDVRR